MLCDKIKYIYNKTFEKSVFRRKVNNMWPLRALKKKRKEKWLPKYKIFYEITKHKFVGKSVT